MSSKVDGRAVRGDATRLRILDAALAVLSEDGYAGTTTRAVAERAGTRLSLVHYHFGSRQHLLVAVLERENERLLKRQRALFAAPTDLSAKWRAACDALDDDLASGYVRVLWELWAAGLAEPELGERWRVATQGWRDLIEGVVAEWIAERGLELPLSARAIASLVANIFQGIEVELLGGVTESEAPHREALRAIGVLIERLEAGGPGQHP
jgi:AcrR family transcriptional regulator